MTSRRSRALFISLVVHAALLVWIWRFVREEKPHATALQIELHYVAPKKPAPPPAPLLPRPDVKALAKSPAPRKLAKEPAAEAPPTVAERSGPSGTGDAPPKSDAAPPTSENAPDLPRALTLSPSLRVGEGLAIPSPRDGGQTWRNVPGGFPVVTPEQEAQRVQEKVSGWSQDTLAEARVDRGEVDPYFLKVRDALTGEAERGGSIFLEKTPVANFMHAWGDGAKTYARTGNPYVSDAIPEKAPAIDDPERPLAIMAKRFPGGPAEETKMRIDMQRTARDFASGKFSEGLVAIVELKQSHEGGLLETKLVAGSGNRTYDSYVLGVAPTALKLLPPAPDLGVGIHAEGIRSQWKFTGKIEYWRKLSELNPIRDGWYIAAAIAGGLTRSDFGAGETEIADFRKPHFSCKAKLLKVY